MTFPPPLAAVFTLAAASLSAPMAAAAFSAPPRHLAALYAELGATSTAQLALERGDRRTACTALSHAAYYESIHGRSSDSRALYRRVCGGFQ